MRAEHLEIPPIGISLPSKFFKTLGNIAQDKPKKAEKHADTVRNSINSHSRVIGR